MKKKCYVVISPRGEYVEEYEEIIVFATQSKHKAERYVYKANYLLNKHKGLSDYHYEIAKGIRENNKESYEINKKFIFHDAMYRKYLKYKDLHELRIERHDLI